MLEEQKTNPKGRKFHLAPWKKGSMKEVPWTAAVLSTTRGSDARGRELNETMTKISCKHWTRRLTETSLRFAQRQTNVFRVHWDIPLETFSVGNSIIPAEFCPVFGQGAPGNLQQVPPAVPAPSAQQPPPLRSLPPLSKLPPKQSFNLPRREPAHRAAYVSTASGCICSEVETPRSESQSEGQNSPSSISGKRIWG